MGVGITMSLVLLWGMPADRPFAAVLAALKRRGTPTVVLDQRDGSDAEGSLIVDPNVSGFLNWNSHKITLETVTAAYLRAYDFRRLPKVAAAGPNSQVWHRCGAIEELINAWADITPASVLNRPAAMSSNNSKPFQSAWLNKLGFATPDTLVTTDPLAAIAFWERHRSVIYKSISGIRSIVSKLTDTDRDRLSNIKWCPTQFQQYIPGVDVRVHVVGHVTFACQIVASVDDYRYSDGMAKVSPCDLPNDVRERCIVVSTTMQLPFCGIDLRRTPGGQWYCFEVNPSPGFTFFQYETGHQIDEAVADFLTA
jgi:hypothetical protein